MDDKNSLSINLGLLLFMLTAFLFCNAQEESITGIVIDQFSNPVSKVLIVLKKKDSTTVIKTGLTNENGVFILENLKKQPYFISTRHLAFENKELLISDNNFKEYVRITVENRIEELKDVVIKSKPQPLKKKKDTTTYNLLDYIDSNDRKLKDLIEKLPGLTLDGEGGIYYQGERISKLLVENEEFFGGGTKLGLDNIPADAIEKLEVIANYSSSQLLRDTRVSKDKVINLVLKEDKKNLLFGNAELGTDFNRFYNMKLALFFFKKGMQNNTIASTNNIAQNPLSINESYALSNVDSDHFKLIDVPVPNSISDIRVNNFSNQFITHNLKLIKDKSVWDFVTIYNRSRNQMLKEQSLEYLNNNSFENLIDSKENDESVFYSRLTNRARFKHKERLFAAALSKGAQDDRSILQTSTDVRDAFVQQIDDKDTFNMSMLFEEIRNLSSRWKATYGIQFNSKWIDSDFSINSSSPFLESYIDWNNQTAFEIDRVVDYRYLNPVAASSFYYTISNKHVFSLKSRFSYGKESYGLKQSRLGGDLGVRFNTNAELNKTEIKNEFSYKFKNRDFHFNAGIEVDQINLNFQNINYDTKQNDTFLNPFIYLSYDFNNKKNLSFNSSRKSEIPDINEFNDVFLVSSYRAISAGSSDAAVINIQRYRLKYSDLNVAKNYSFTSQLFYQLNESQLSYDFEFIGIDALNSLLVINRPGDNLRFNARLLYFIDKVQLGINTKVQIKNNNFGNLQSLRNFQTNEYNLGGSLKTIFKKIPNISINYDFSQNLQMIDFITNDFNNYTLTASTDYSFTERFYTFLSYSRTGYEGVSSFDRMNFELRYSNKKGSMDFSLVGLNTFSQERFETLNQNFLQFSNTTVFGLGRRILLKLTYNF